MVIQCFADESGIHDESGVSVGGETAVVAGYVAWQEQWDSFAPEWLETLSFYRVSPLVFHWAEFNKEGLCKKSCGCESPYHGWDKAKRDRFIHDLIPAVRDNTAFAVGVGVDLKAYNRVWPQELREGMGHPYYLCFQVFFPALLYELRKRTAMRSEPVHFFFDQQDQFKHDAIRVYDAFRADDPSDAELMGGIAFEDKTKYIPLQAADLFAARVRKVLTRYGTGTRTLTKGGWDEALSSRKNLHTEFLGEPQLKNMLERVMGGQVPIVNVNPPKST